MGKGPNKRREREGCVGHCTIFCHFCKVCCEKMAANTGWSSKISNLIIFLYFLYPKDKAWI